MSAKQKLGKKAEDSACIYLVDKGYQIIQRNWRFSKAEIDIIAKDSRSDTLVFIEVKSRTYNAFGEPESGVSRKKIKLVSDAASVYMEQSGYNWAIRFDIIGVQFNNKDEALINHFEDAFLM
jgi:putative endonuclease